MKANLFRGNVKKMKMKLFLTLLGVLILVFSTDGTLTHQSLTNQFKKINIAILLPTTSRTKNGYCSSCNNFFTVALPNIKATIPPNDLRYKYTIYVGYDTGDTMWNHPARLQSIMDISRVILQDQNIQLVPVEVKPYPDPKKGSLTNVWNKLAQQAYQDENSYFFLANDDLVINTFDLLHYLVNALQHNPVMPGFGQAAPIDTSFHDKYHPTFPMVSKLHLIIFGDMYSTEIFSRGCDTWLGDVYRGFNGVMVLDNATVMNSAYGTERRYDNDFDMNKYTMLVVNARRRIKEFLAKYNIHGNWLTGLCDVPLTFGCN